MTDDGSNLTTKQQEFIHYYVKYHNATRAAGLAGYEGDDNALGVAGHRLLRDAKIRTEIDRLFREQVPSADETLQLIGTAAKFDPTPYLQDDMTLDVHKMGQDGLGTVIEGVKPGRYGPEVTLASPQTAQKMLAQYHRLLRQQVDMDVTATASMDAADIANLAQQLAAIQQQIEQRDDT